MGACDASYECVIQREDAAGKVGTPHKPKDMISECHTRYRQHLGPELETYSPQHHSISCDIYLSL